MYVPWITKNIYTLTTQGFKIAKDIKNIITVQRDISIKFFGSVNFIISEIKQT